MDKKLIFRHIKLVSGFSLALLLSLLLTACNAGNKPSPPPVSDPQEHTIYRANWAGTRIWIGPEFWANSLTDWKIENGIVYGTSAPRRTLHLIPYRITEGLGEFRTSIDIFSTNISKKGSTWGGYILGITGPVDGNRSALVNSKGGLEIGIRDNGVLFIGEKMVLTNLDISRPINLTTQLQPGLIKLTASQNMGADHTLTAIYNTSSIAGNIALASISNSGGFNSAWAFSNWNVSGNRLSKNTESEFGPIFWSQYFLDRNTLRLTAHLAPSHDPTAKKAYLETEKNPGVWVRMGTTTIDTLSSTATFELPEWDTDRETNYRVVYSWEKKDYFWEGTIRKPPVDKDEFKLAVLSCDHGELFPNSKISRNVALQNPDMIFFAGDQIYEGYGGMAPKRNAPIKTATQDYLWKYWQFGWSWRDLLKNRPSVIIPDDHDYYQGNIWGDSCKALAQSEDGSYELQSGGFLMSPAWINAMQRTQVSHLPPPASEDLCGDGIETFYTSMNYAGIDFAVLEDRKFKTSPKTALEAIGTTSTTNDQQEIIRQAGESTGSDNTILGDKQLTFLENWIATREPNSLKFVMSQTIFAKASTHAGRPLARRLHDFDSNGWPSSSRNNVLRALQTPGVLMIHGDQHFGSLLQHGIDDWEDGPLAFMTTGTSNGFPRAWWPQSDTDSPPPSNEGSTGRFYDDFANKVTVIATGNPDINFQTAITLYQDLVEIQNAKGSGHGMLLANKRTGNITFELWHLDFNAALPKIEDQFHGFPITMNVLR